MRDIAQIAVALSVLERAILAKAGEALWFDLPHPWQPLPGKQETTAQRLASLDVGLLCPVEDYLGAYALTPLGEVVAGWFLQQGSAIAHDGALLDLIWHLTPLQRDVLCTVAALSQRTVLNSRVAAVAVGLANPEWGLLTPGAKGFTLTALGLQVLTLLTEEAAYA